MVFSWLFILRQNLIQYILKLNTCITILDYMMCLMKINLQINKKKMLKMNKGIFTCLLGIVGCPWVIRLT